MSVMHKLPKAFVSCHVRYIRLLRSSSQVHAMLACCQQLLLWAKAAVETSARVFKTHTVHRRACCWLQGWGNWFNTMVLVVLLACFHENKAPYQTSHLNDVWRISYAIGLVPIITMLVWRIFFLRVSRCLIP